MVNSGVQGAISANGSQHAPQLRSKLPVTTGYDVSAWLRLMRFVIDIVDIQP